MPFSRTRHTCRTLACLALSIATAMAAGAQQTPGANVSAAALHVPAVKQLPHPLSPETRGDIYMARKMYREAIDAYREGPANSAVLANKIGIAFHELLQFNLAQKYYRRSMKLNPKYPQAVNNLGTIDYGRKKYKKSIKLYKRAIKLYGVHPPASIYANLGAAYFGRKKYKRAMSAYRDALKIDPEVFEHHSSFGTLMQERTIAEQALFHLYLAKLYAKSGDSPHAILYLRKALEEGVKGRKNIPKMPEFASLKKNAAFQELLAENPKPL
ncbi:MAG: tetratricopeptide repeat protein [Bryobacteraceae bacterium]